MRCTQKMKKLSFCIKRGENQTNLAVIKNRLHEWATKDGSIKTFGRERSEEWENFRRRIFSFLKFYIFDIRQQTFGVISNAELKWEIWKKEHCTYEGKYGENFQKLFVRKRKNMTLPTCGSYFTNIAKTPTAGLLRYFVNLLLPPKNRSNCTILYSKFSLWRIPNLSTATV